MTEIRARKGYDLGGGSRGGLKGARAQTSRIVENASTERANCVSVGKKSRFTESLQTDRVAINTNLLVHVERQFKPITLHAATF